jgi:hypothetical protein
MKKSILSFILLLAIGSTRLFAFDGHEISKQIMASFNREFSDAKQVKWTKEKSYSDASFVLDGQIMKAYYNEDAELMAVVHHVLTDHLPIYLLASLKSNYNDFWVSELFESANDKESAYHIRLENADQVIELRSVNSTDWVTEKRIRKNVL